jgi:threonine/homoserine/homoserine lactone efflux protein
MTLTFLLTSLVIVATPGTGALYTIAAGLGRGRRAGVIAAFGCTLGILPHLLAAVTGAAALLQASGRAFEVLRAAGVAYLLYMAIATWRDRSALTGQPDAVALPARRIITSAVLVNLLNPKLTLFFFAFLPQFVGGEGSGDAEALPAMLGLSAVFMLMTFVVFAAYGVFAAGVRSHVVARPRVVDRLRRVFAVSFLALGAKLATTDR